MIKQQVCLSTYFDALLIAAGDLRRLGVQPASLYDPVTGDLTKDGDTLIHDAIEGACHQQLLEDLGKIAEGLGTILADRAVLDHYMARLDMEEEVRRLNQAQADLDAGALSKQQ